jgi:hypothetical protein
MYTAVRGKSSSVRQVNAERLRKHCVLDAVQGSPRTNVHRISVRTDIPPTDVWRLLHGDDFYLRRSKECKTDYRESFVYGCPSLSVCKLRVAAFFSRMRLSLHVITSTTCRLFVLGHRKIRKK